MPIYSKALFALSGLVLLGLGFIALSTSQTYALEKQPLAPSHTGATMAPLYGFRLPDIDGQPVDLKTFKGKVLLIVNTASMCGNTPQYAGLQEMYERYQERGSKSSHFRRMILGSRSRGLIKKSKDSATHDTASVSPCSQKSAWLGKISIHSTAT